MAKKILFLFGTRPEAIKMAPLIIEFGKWIKYFEVITCVTAQHRELLDDVLSFFEISPQYDLNLMQPNQDLLELSSKAIKEISLIIKKEKPNLIFVQGDTLTAFIGAYCGSLSGIKVAHIEAGLRTYNKYAPFPEEMNRKMISALADYHFAATEKARINILKEGIPKETILVTGNTVIDGLLLGIEKLRHKNDLAIAKFLETFPNHKVILLTAHRRENFGKPLENICEAVFEFISKNEKYIVIYPVHPNPNVKKIVKQSLQHKRIFLVEPLDYPNFIWIMQRSHIILTDSGGIQEEAPTLNKPILVLRNETERQEGVEAGCAKLVGTEPKKICNELSKLDSDMDYYQSMTSIPNPYGDGLASQRVVNEIMKVYEQL